MANKEQQKNENKQKTITEIAKQKARIEQKKKEEIAKKIEQFNTNGKMTIAIFCDTFYPIIDGVITVMDNYAKRLMEWANVVVCVPKHDGKTVKKEYMVLAANSLYFKFVNYDLGFPQQDVEFNKFIKALRIDIIHIHSPFNMGSYATKLAKKRKIPIVATFHSSYREDVYKATKSKALTSAIMSTLMKPFIACNEVWTMHNGTKQTLIEYGYKNDPSTIKLMSNATEYRYPENANELVDKVDNLYKLKGQQNVFLFVGRIVKLKNVFFIADSLKLIKDKGLPFKMIFVGNGPDEKGLKEYIEELGLKDDVIFTGKIANRQTLAGLYLRSDLFLFPSVNDMSSIVQIEAACHHTPVVFIENTNTAQTITNNVNGFTSANDTESFANRVVEICKDPKFLKQVGENAFKQIYVHWDDVVKKAYEMYQELIYKNHEEMYRKFVQKNSQKLVPLTIKKSKK